MGYSGEIGFRVSRYGGLAYGGLYQPFPLVSHFLCLTMGIVGIVVVVGIKHRI